jgi:hypothetical protein
LVELDSARVKQFLRLVAWKQGWEADGRPEASAPAPSFDYGTVKQVVQSQTRLTADQKAEIIELYRGRVAVKEIAAEYRIDRATVRSIAKVAGLEPHLRGLSDDDVRRAAHRYSEGASLATIGRELSVDGVTVMHALKRQGVRMRPRQGGRQRTMRLRTGIKTRGPHGRAS